MASSSNSISKITWIRYANMRCLCQRVAEIKVSLTYRNPNRLFYTCKEDKCKLFCWCEPIPDDIGGEQIDSNVAFVDSRISRIEEEVSNLKKEIDDVTESMKGVEDEVCAMKVEFVNGLSVLKKELDDAFSDFIKRVEDDFAAVNNENGCLYSEISTLKKQLKAMEQSNGRLRFFMIGIVFVVISIVIGIVG
ncbi:hypothetical protein QL285_010998 [Trifolium repens]|nr:hypothetical protein QL285_010998 [Trifolium repens]